MKETGIIRALDNLGRIVLPIELRRKFDLNEKDELEIYVDNDQIILKKYNPSCIFCDSSEEIMEYEGKLICKSCAKKLSSKSK